MIEWVTEVEFWYIGFLLSGLWICVGVLFYLIQQNRRRRRETAQRQQQEKLHAGGVENLEELERRYQRRG